MCGLYARFDRGRTVWELWAPENSSILRSKWSANRAVAFTVHFYSPEGITLSPTPYCSTFRYPLQSVSSYRHYETAGRMSVCLSVCPSVRPPVSSFVDSHTPLWRVCCWAPRWQEISTDSGTALSSKCEQCHVVNWCRKLNADLF